MQTYMQHAFIHSYIHSFMWYSFSHSHSYCSLHWKVRAYVHIIFKPTPLIRYPLEHVPVARGWRFREPPLCFHRSIGKYDTGYKRILSLLQCNIFHCVRYFVRCGSSYGHWALSYLAGELIDCDCPADWLCTHLLRNLQYHDLCKASDRSFNSWIAMNEWMNKYRNK